MYYSKREKRQFHLRKALEQRKKNLKTQPAHLNITAFVVVFVPNAQWEHIYMQRLLMCSRHATQCHMRGKEVLGQITCHHGNLTSGVEGS